MPAGDPIPKFSSWNCRNEAYVMTATDTLAAFLADIVSGAIRVVDLTHTLTPEFPAIALPPEFGQSQPFRIEEISHYDDRGASWYWNNFSCGEHTGTHFDAPAHWVSGRDLPNNTTDTIPLSNFLGSACVIDCVAEAQADPDFLMTVEFVQSWEARHGRIEDRSWVLMHTGWAARKDPASFQNYDAQGQHTPGPDPECVKFLVTERNVLGFGTETIGTDAGQAAYLRPPYPCHFFMHGANRYGLQCLANLDQLPPKGAVLVCPPLKIVKGSGSPLRVMAFVPNDHA